MGGGRKDAGIIRPLTLEVRTVFGSDEGTSTVRYRDMNGQSILYVGA